MKFDFHCHSNISDGKLSPCDLIDYAVDRKVELLALTDHDSIDGLDEAHDYIKNSQLPIKLVNGVEISALTEFGEVHIVGLGVDISNNELNSQLKIQQEKRWDRAREYAEKLAKIGVEGIFETIEKIGCKVVTRSHIARALVELNYAKDMEQAFKRFIGKQGKVKVPKNWMSLSDAILLIRQAGGITVLAHPTRYPLSNRKLSYLIETYKSCGGQAIELSYPSLNKDKMEWLKLHAEKNNLLASSGSDFHYPDLRWTDLGRFPAIDNTIPHVLDKLSHIFQKDFDKTGAVQN